MHQVFERLFGYKPNDQTAARSVPPSVYADLRRTFIVLIVLGSAKEFHS